MKLNLEKRISGDFVTTNISKELLPINKLLKRHPDAIMHENHLERLLQAFRFILDGLQDPNPILDAARITQRHYNCV